LTQGCSDASIAIIGPIGDDLAVGEDRNPVATVMQAVEIVRDHENGQAPTSAAAC
jgi:hypothetical protein